MALVDLFQATPSDGGVTIPVIWLLTSAAAVVGAVFASVKVLLNRIDQLHQARIIDRDATIATLTKRIERLETKEDEGRAKLDKTVTLLEESVTTQRRTAEALEAMYERDKQPVRRSRTGDD